MTTNTIRLLFAASLFLIGSQVRAHDPSQHTAEAKDPDCSAIHSMADTASIEQDPVIMAMKMRCDMANDDQGDMKTMEQSQEGSGDMRGEGHQVENDHHVSH